MLQGAISTALDLAPVCEILEKPKAAFVFPGEQLDVRVQ